MSQSVFKLYAHSTNNANSIAGEQLYSATDSSSSEVIYVDTTPATEAISETFNGKKDASKRGKHSVLICSIPNTLKTYTFALARKGVRHDSYICVQCEKHKAWRSIKVSQEESTSYTWLDSR
ncbi:unnamed protein product [Cylicostephanus goldi]|uniref:Uncharacterized protein n=1 Tax=Cylicostephanus goldi TaxID=71465 RepID=A0A3P7R3P2_CYLGO|nr:unnamed protein product [Cylicostephanus goldi]